MTGVGSGAGGSITESIPANDKKTRHKGGFRVYWLGDKDYSACGLALRAAVAGAPGVHPPCGRVSNLEVLILFPHTHKTRHKGGFRVYWLGDKDSNLGWRSQSPQSCR